LGLRLELGLGGLALGCMYCLKIFCTVVECHTGPLINL